MEKEKEKSSAAAELQQEEGEEGEEEEGHARLQGRARGHEQHLREKDGPIAKAERTKAREPARRGSTQQPGRP